MAVEKRQLAVRQLAVARPVTGTVVDVLRRLVEAGEEPLAGQARVSVHDLGPESIPLLVDRYKERTLEARIFLADVLSRYGLEAANASEALDADAEGESAQLKAHAAVAAWKVTGRDLSRAVQAVRANLSSENPEVRLDAVKLAGRLGSAKRCLAAELADLSADQDKGVRDAAEFALEAEQYFEVSPSGVEAPDCAQLTSAHADEVQDQEIECFSA